MRVVRKAVKYDLPGSLLAFSLLTVNLPTSTRLVLSALALLAVAIRWAERSRLVYSWDSVHYVLAQDRYNLLTHQPHPPGSYFYVLLARVLRLLSGDPHTALLLISSVSGAAMVVALFHLGRELAHDEHAGWLAAVTGATAPLFWFYGTVALNYGPAGALSALVALGCVRACDQSREPEHVARGVLLAGVSLGLLGGFRPTDLVFLAPAYGWTLWCAHRTGLSARTLLGGPAILVLLTAGWLIPSLVNTGGLAGYVASIRGQEHLLARSSALLGGDPALRDAIYTHKRSLESLLGALWLPALASPLAMLLRKPAGAASYSAVIRIGLLGVLILLPPAAFYLFGHFNSPGYAMTYGGFVVGVGAAATAGMIRGATASPKGALAVTVATALLVAGGNTALFLHGWPRVKRIGQRSLSAAEIRDHDRYYQDLRAFLQATHRPGEARLLASWNATDGLRVVQALLPEYAPDVAQAVAEVPHLPPGFAALPWLRLLTPEQLRREGRTVYLVSRTDEDPAYHSSLFGGRWEEVPIGSRHHVFRLVPGMDRPAR